MFPHACIRRLQEHGIVMCRYAWDSVRNKPYAKTLDSYMLAVASFDPEDCEREGYKYVPLYSGANAGAPTDPCDIAFLYYATFQINRHSVMSKIIDASFPAAATLELKTFFQSRKLCFLLSLLTHAMWNSS